VEKSNKNVEQSPLAWAKEALGRAVDEILEIGLFDEPLIEAKPVWMYPQSFVIGKVRAQGEDREFLWVICGEAPLDYFKSTLADTPRDAARHFAMKWQLDAARRRDPALNGDLDADARVDLEAECERIASRAESLFKLIAIDALWN
jgi:Domain of unknown function (DUF4826)